MSGRHRYKNLDFQAEVYIEGKVLGVFSVQMLSYEIDITREVSIDWEETWRQSPGTLQRVTWIFTQDSAGC